MLIECPECSHRISNLAVSCPRCGVPIACPECGHMHSSVEKLVSPPDQRGEQTKFRIMTIVTALSVMGLIWFGLQTPKQQQSGTETNQTANSSTQSIAQSSINSPLREAQANNPFNQSPSSPDVQTAALAAPQPPAATFPSTFTGVPILPKPEVALKFAESGTLGGSLTQSLVEAFFRGKGLTKIETTAAENIGGSVIWELANPARQNRAIRISLREALSPPERLDRNEAFIGNLSAADNRFAQLRTSEYTGSQNEHLSSFLIALESLVFIVHPDNPVVLLSKDQLTALLTGMVSDWRQLGGRPGKIEIYTPRTFEAFQSIRSQIVGNLPISADIRRFDDQDEIGKQVTQNIDAIGLVGFSYLNNAKALGISVAGKTPVVPNHHTIAKRSYPLSRPIYLYTSSQSKTILLEQFVAFTRSKSARTILAQKGYIVPTVIPMGLPDIRMSLADYRILTDNAMRLSYEIYFRPNTTELNATGYRSIDRMSDFLKSLGMADKKLMLFGFTDSLGIPRNNLILSEKRARVVAKAFNARGIDAELAVGLGAQNPVADNETLPGRNQNRRVELWLMQHEDET